MGRAFLAFVALAVFLSHDFAARAKASSPASQIPRPPQAQPQPQKLSSRKFQVCGEELELEIADNPEARSTGLMHRSGIKPGTGMLFVFPYEQPLVFWMKNVPFDIDIGYFDSKGTIVSWATMKGTSPLQKAEQLPNYPSQGLALTAVEVPAGFFSNRKDARRCRLRPPPAAASY